MINETDRVYFNAETPYDGHYGLGEQFMRTQNVIMGSYDFAVQGGAVGTINLLDQAGRTIILPINTIIKQVYIDIITPIVSTSNDGTLALTANSSGDLLAAVDGDTLSGIVSGIPTGTANTMVKLTADRTLKMAIAVHAFTAGKFNVFFEYVQSSL